MVADPDLEWISRSRRVYLASMATTGLGLAGCLTLPSDGDHDRPTVITDGFETDLAAWERVADVPEDPNNPGNPVAWEIERSTERAASGTASLQLVLDGRQDDGTIWVVRPIDIASGRAYGASVSVSAWSASESFNTTAHLVAFLGPRPPVDEASFPRPGENSTGQDRTSGGLREPLNRAAGWDRYAFSWRTPVLNMNQLYLAVGISAVWETELSYFVDDVTVTLVPR